MSAPRCFGTGTNPDTGQKVRLDTCGACPERVPCALFVIAARLAPTSVFHNIRREERENEHRYAR